MRQQTLAKLFCGCALFVLLLSANAAHAQSITLAIGEHSGASGDKFKIPVNVEDVDGLGAIQFVVSYDTATLEITEVQAGDAAQGASADLKKREDGNVRIAMISGSGLSKDGPLLVLKGKVLGKPGDSASINIREARAWTFEDSLEMALVTRSGEFQVDPAQRDVAAWPWWYWIGIGAAVLVVILIVARLGRK